MWWPGFNWKEPWKPFEGALWWDDYQTDERELRDGTDGRSRSPRRPRPRLPLRARALVAARWLLWVLAVLLLLGTVVGLVVS